MLGIKQTEKQSGIKKKVVIELFGHSILTGLLRSSATRLFQNHTAKKSRIFFLRLV